MWNVSLVFSRGEHWWSSSPWFFCFQHWHRCHGVAGWKLRRTICIFTGEHTFEIYPKLQSLFSRELHLAPTCVCCNIWAGCRLNSSDPLNCLLIQCWRFFNCIWSRFAILVAGFASRSSSHQKDWQAAKVSSYPRFLISIESNINLNVPCVRPLQVKVFSQSPQNK